MPHRRVALLAAVAAAASIAACAPTLSAELTDDVVRAQAAAPSVVPQSPAAATPSREGLQATLDVAAAAFLAHDADTLRGLLDDPESEFGQRWLARLDNARDVPFGVYRLTLDESLPDLASDAVRARVGDTAQVAYVIEEVGIDGYDPLGPAVEDLFLTVVRREGQWRLVADSDAENLGLVSADHLWDMGPVRATTSAGFLVLHHPESAGEIATLASEAEIALNDVRTRWPLDWPQQVVLIVPRDEEELAELLHVTFDLTNFVAFATSTPSGQLGDYRLQGARVILNSERFLARSSDIRRRILAHELLHVATRPASGPHVPAWVEEGVAQRMGELESTTGTALLDALVASGDFDGTPPDDSEFVTGGRDRIYLSYQLAWSFVDHLVDAYGDLAVAEFYESLGTGGIGEPGRERFHLDRAAREVFGLSFDELRQGWVDALT